MTNQQRPRLTGEERKAKARDLAKKYRRGSTIRSLAARSGLPYGTVRNLLLEVKTPLRARGGRLPRTKAKADR
ncbi:MULTISPECIES: helix-turn-helix domain-containing protein [Streptomyces]|uniref:helix-turn-helix domain-containing protein n=1 Tax=Streptomyces TaxID=1883 RepID=UPI002E0D8DB0|nr:helix-turn-helix domain-containing protein [Streptomyces europaeiscabiei]